MNALFLRLWLTKALRSVSFSRNLIWSIILGIIILFFLANLGLLAFGLPVLLRESLENQTPLDFVNKNLLYFFLLEFIYRFFMQRMPVIELENFLHLPVKRSDIVNYLILRSFVSPFSMISLILFAPFSVTMIGGIQGVAWLFTIILVSLTLHAFMLWFKQKFGEALIGVLMVALIAFGAFGANYYGYFNIGEVVAPFFELARETYIPLAFMAGVFGLMCILAARYYVANAYTEDLANGQETRFLNSSLGFLSRFGLAGEMADVEWKLVLRHKKSRNYLFISLLFLLYGLLFYNDTEFQKEEGFSAVYIFVGIFITGSFMIQYGQLFLSWNSSYFDFYLNRREGIRALIEGKYLLFAVISILCFFLTTPYIYFGWEIVLVNFACLIFNLGITSQVIISIALWKPKPMDLTKGAFFNYEGVGMAQFIMVIPIMILPYLVYLPFSFLLSDYIGLLFLSLMGVAGLLFKDRLLGYSIDRVTTDRYKTSASFRQEL